MRIELRQSTQVSLGKETVLPPGVILVMCNGFIWIVLGQAFIVPGMPIGSKLGLLAEAILAPFAFMVPDATSGLIMKGFVRCGCTARCLQVSTGVIFFVLFSMMQGTFDAVYLNEDLSISFKLAHFVSIFALGLLLRHVAN